MKRVAIALAFVLVCAVYGYVRGAQTVLRLSREFVNGYALCVNEGGENSHTPRDAVYRRRADR